MSQTRSTAFGPYSAFPTGSWPEAVAIGDLNNDGRNDVVMTTSTYSNTNDQSILIFFQTATGTLAAPVRYAAGASATSVAIADFNGDGTNDIAVGKGSAGIRIFYQGPGGTFDNFTDYPTPNANWICAGDFNNDGRSDVAGIGWSSQQVDVFTQTPGGTLSFFGQYSANYAGYNDLEAGDVNHDGLTDIVVMSGQLYSTPNVSVLFQTNGGFASAVPYDLGGNELTAGVGIGDLNADGRNDIVVSFGGNRPASKISVFNQQSDGTLLRGATFDSYDIPEAVVVADVDRDGLADVITVHGGWQELGVYFQNSGGTFTSEQLFGLPYASHYNTHGLALGDINGDGMPDVVIADYNHGLVILTNRIPPPPKLIRQLTDIGVSNGFPHFTLNGQVGNSYVVQISSNLIDWLPLVTNTIPAGGSIPITDTTSPNLPRRFYRAASQPIGNTSNDLFSDRISIPGSGATVFSSNVGASIEPGEPNHGGVTGGKSLWWTWTAPANGLATVSTDGSSFDTTLGVYQGTAVNSLTVIVGDDDGGEGQRSRVLFSTTAGAVYQIAVDGFNGASGDIQLTLKPGLLNDAFADRLQLTGSTDGVLGSNIGATREPGEPYHLPGNNGGASVWWTWKAPSSGPVIFSTEGSSFDTVLAAYTGNSLSGLSQVASNDDYNGLSTSQIGFSAVAGTTYQIAVDGYDGVTGVIYLSVQQ